MPAADGRIYQHRQSGNHRPFRQLHGGLQHPSVSDYPIRRPTGRRLRHNHALQIIYTPREQQDANEYSEMLGYTTVKRRNVSRGRERSVSESEERRALMLPQELKGMSQDNEIILYEGMAHPAKVNKIRYYQDGMFTKRLRGAVKVASLKGGQQ